MINFRITPTISGGFRVEKEVDGLWHACNLLGYTVADAEYRDCFWIYDNERDAQLAVLDFTGTLKVKKP